MTVRTAGGSDPTPERAGPGGGDRDEGAVPEPGSAPSASPAAASDEAAEAAASPDLLPPKQALLRARRRHRRPTRRTRFWARLGLRARITFLFGFGALLLSVVMGGLSFFSARHFLLNERQAASQHQAYVNAAYVKTVLLSAHSQTDPLNTLDAGPGSTSVLFDDGRWYSSSISVGRSSIPLPLQMLVLNGTPATQTIDLAGSPEIVVGISIPSEKAAYFEFFYVGDLAHTLGVLAAVLFATGLVTTVLGVAVGRSASGRSLRPLTGVSKAAVAIAGGQLDTRLPGAAGDPDLAGLTSSFNRMVDQLQERIEREARFTSDVSHELRSPLTTLAATLDVLEAHRLELSPRALRALDLLSDDLHRFQRMVGDLLEISRSDTGSAELSREQVVCGELVERSVAAAVRSLPVDVSPPDVFVDPRVADAELWVDKRRIERIVANLLENAALYAGGATAVHVFPGPRSPTGRATVQIAVDDEGQGIVPSERSKIFERFYRGLASGRRGTGTGTGLGLALVSEHVRLHGGRVWVEASPAGGSRFVVELLAGGAEAEL
jgi:two-component system sensor histidine kinase MtrB